MTRPLRTAVTPTWFYLAAVPMTFAFGSAVSEAFIHHRLFGAIEFAGAGAVYALFVAGAFSTRVRRLIVFRVR